MKARIVAATTLTLALFATGAHAQFQSPTTNLNNNTSSSAQTNSSAGASNAGNAQSITFNSEAQNRLKAAPALGGNSFYGSFSSDSCMVGAGLGVSIVGFGSNAVTPIRDTQCDIRRSFERTMQAAASQPKRAEQLTQAANDMLCSLGGPVFKALNNQSLCSDWVVQEQGGSSTKSGQKAEVNYGTIRGNFDDLYFTGG